MNNLGRYNPFIRPLHLCDSNDFTTKHYVDQVAALLEDFAKLVETTRAWVPGRKNDFYLTRSTISAAANITDEEDKRERIIEHRLFEKFEDQKNGPVIDGILSHIPCFQIPLRAPGQKKLNRGWGEIDLLGCTPSSNLDPVIIELKVTKEGKTPETPLRIIVEGIAYAIALQEMWDQKDNNFRQEWCDKIAQIPLENAPKSLAPVKIIGLASIKYWEHWADAAARHHHKGDWGKATSDLIDKAKDQFEINFASFDEEDISKGIQLVCHKSFQPMS